MDTTYLLQTGAGYRSPTREGVFVFVVDFLLFIFSNEKKLTFLIALFFFWLGLELELAHENTLWRLDLVLRIIPLC